jgi:hypothetical protein|nr:MAG TPA: hypothetical protein [Caudoviricetes sp.]
MEENLTETTNNSSDNGKIITGDNNKTFLEVFGFVSNQARMNLVIFFITILIASNVFFIWRTSVLNNRLIETEREKNIMINDFNTKIIEEVRKQVQPTKVLIRETIDKIDSLNTLDNQFKNKK